MIRQKFYSCKPILVEPGVFSVKYNLGGRCPYCKSKITITYNQLRLECATCRWGLKFDPTHGYAICAIDGPLGTKHEYMYENGETDLTQMLNTTILEDQLERSHDQKIL